MEQRTQRPSGVRGFQIIHASLVLGVALAGVMFFTLLKVRHLDSLGVTPSVGSIVAVLNVAFLVTAVVALRPRVPVRRFDEAPEQYWASVATRSATIVLWAALEAAALLGWIGYLLTGRPLPAATGLLAFVALAWYRPSQLEGDGAA
jgi:hypothetical protein